MGGGRPPPNNLYCKWYQTCSLRHRAYPFSEHWHTFNPILIPNPPYVIFLLHKAKKIILNFRIFSTKELGKVLNFQVWVALRFFSVKGKKPQGDVQRPTPPPPPQMHEQAKKCELGNCSCCKYFIYKALEYTTAWGAPKESP